MSAKKPRITSHDVAREAGVSQSVVSRAFTPGGKVAPETRKRVLAVARRLGYRPNAFARSLVRQSSSIVGILMARIDNHFYPVVLDALTSKLQAVGRQVMFFSAETDDEVEDVLLSALEYRVEAMILTSVTLSSKMASVFSEVGIPVVLFNRHVDDPDVRANVRVVACDNLAGGRAAADALFSAGHTRFAYLGGAPDTSTNRHRKTGFMARLAELGAKLELAVEGSYSYAWGQQAATAFLSHADAPDAIFCGNDLIAFGVLDALRDRGRRVPEEVSVLGFDDIPAAAWSAYRLSTFRQPVDAMVVATLETLELSPKRMPSRQHSEAPVLLPVTFVRRGTLRDRSSLGSPQPRASPEA